ncbi:MAG: RDD family protein [Pirellulaceae bacterium]|jgi:uncharacterized RDD family membrane protein YckC|nr:RDD family protein [Pirellulaceae bacterium]MDP7018335.1 RDD family protein [Pirellulaceae bacterium]
MSAKTRPIESTIDIVTPENISFHYVIAGPFRRFPAFLIDLIAKGFLTFIIAQIFGFILPSGIGDGVVLIIFFAISWFYGPLFECYWNGQTPGKRLLGLRVLTTSGRPIDGAEAVLRNVLRTVDMLPPMATTIGMLPVAPTFVIGLIVMASNNRFQRMGDLVAGTMVVVEERRWLTGVVRFDDSRVAQLATYLPADLQVSPSMAKALAMYAERRRFFSPARRREVAKHLAAPLLTQYGLREDTSHDLLLCSLYYRAFVTDRADEEQYAPIDPAGRPPSSVEPPNPFLTGSGGRS